MDDAALAAQRLELLRNQSEELLRAVEAAQARGMDANDSGTRLTNRMRVEIAVGRLFTIADLLAGARDLQASEIQITRDHHLSRVITSMPSVQANQATSEPESP